MFAFDSPWISSQRRRVSPEDDRRERLRMEAVQERQAKQRREQQYIRQQQLRQQRRLQQQEAECLRQRQEYERMLRQREKEEEEQREAYDAALLRRARAQAEAEKRQRSQYYFTEESDEEEEEQQEFKIVRGTDGRLYRVRNPSYQETSNAPRRSAARRTEPNVVRGRDGKLYRVDNSRVPVSKSSGPQGGSFDDMESTSSSGNYSERRTHAMDIDDPATGKKVGASTKLKKKKKSKNGKKKKKKITVIVEDASDSEYDDEYKSPWRNRRPSPGQWMEPVENFH